MTTAKARHRVRNYLGTILVATAAAALTAADVAYLMRTTSGRATVREATTLGYRAAGAARDVVAEHEVEGRTVVARFRTWYYPVRRGDVIAIRYRPGSPDEAALDDFWQLHYAAVWAWLLVAAVAVGETMASAHRRHMARITRSLARAEG